MQCRISYSLESSRCCKAPQFAATHKPSWSSVTFRVLHIFHIFSRWPGKLTYVYTEVVVQVPTSIGTLHYNTAALISTQAALSWVVQCHFTLTSSDSLFFFFLTACSSSSTSAFLSSKFQTDTKDSIDVILSHINKIKMCRHSKEYIADANISMQANTTNATNTTLHFRILLCVNFARLCPLLWWPVETHTSVLCIYVKRKGVQILVDIRGSFLLVCWLLRFHALLSNMHLGLTLYSMLPLHSLPTSMPIWCCHHLSQEKAPGS